jgi:peptide/nickel transport system permease protein
MIPQLFILSVLVFLMAKAMPGDALTGRQIDPKANPQIIEEQREKMGLNDPWQEQYIRWVKNIAKGDWGVSYTFKVKVTDVIEDRIWNTVNLALLTLIFTYVLAIPLGIISGRYNDSWMDKAITGYTYVGFAMPVFIFAILMLFVFGFALNLFPTGGSVSPKVEEGTVAYAISKLNHMLLPAWSTALISTTSIIQYLRSEVIDNKSKDFVRTARSKGVPETNIYSHHILRNSFLPIAAFLGYEITGLIGGAVIIETIFSYPGIGQLFLSSVQARDFSIVTAVVMMTGSATLLGTLLSDIILSAVDPRIRIEEDR